jgi:hypothetical protein
MESEFPTRTSELAPGMETVVAAGDTLVITDSEGQEFAVTGRESEEVMDFLRSFDRWLTTKNAHVEGLVLEAALADMTKKFNHLPMRLQRELPSFKTIGVTLPT